MKRPTIADIAPEAGVSKGAVSYALNGQAGVSEATRARILEIADRAGFRASTAARALAGAPAKVVGLALRRPPSMLGVEPFFMELISGLEAELSLRSYALLLQMVPDSPADAEIDLYRQWWAERRVDGVLICDVRIDDHRLAAVREMDLPAVVVGPPGWGGPLPTIGSDDAASMTEAVEYLAGLGHRRIARVAGIRELAHTATRTTAYEATCRRLGLAAPVSVWTDYSGEDGARATRELLSAGTPPTAVIYDNDVMAVAGLAVAQELGRDVPGDLSIVAWDDSAVCPLVHPPLTALSRDIAAHGSQAAKLLLAAMAGQPVSDVREEQAHLTVRSSTAPPPGAR